MVVVDISIVTVSLRSIQSDLGFAEARLAWITNAYTIGFGGLLLLSGRLGDLIGRKRMFVTGLALFTVASALCGASQNQEMLIAMRFLQGAGAAMAYAVIMGIIFTIFSNPAELGKAMGISGFGQAAGASIGILAGGLLTDGVNWHWVFYINVPIGLIALVIAIRSVPSDRGLGLDKGADFVGAALVTGGMMLAVYTIATVAENGWASAHTIGFGLGSLVLLAGFVARAATAAQPLVPLGIFRSRNLSGANAVHFLMVGGTMSFNILIALYMQEVAGYSPAETGFAYLPLAVAAGACSVALSARFNMRFGLRNVIVGSLAMVVVGLLPRPAGADRSALRARHPAHRRPARRRQRSRHARGDHDVHAGPLAQRGGSRLRPGGQRRHHRRLIGHRRPHRDRRAHTQSALANGAGGKPALADGFQLSFGIAAALVAAAILVALAVLREVPMGPPPARAGRRDRTAKAGPARRVRPAAQETPGVPPAANPEGALS
ncbi:MFS transporter [Streptomyces thinghirensis]|nr:MFS transporter [Streptomyces thinghirensis]